MKNKLLCTLLTAVGFCFVSAAFSADAPALADRHAKLGVMCESCHAGVPAAGAKVKNDKCFACHQNYEAVAKRTEKVEPNPHYTHLGNVRCSDCHKGHTEGAVMCNECHKFNLKVK
jgi:fumarate reductase flavoprotein subunit